jgi:hypothetical protein
MSQSSDFALSSCTETTNGLLRDAHYSEHADFAKSGRSDVGLSDCAEVASSARSRVVPSLRADFGKASLPDFAGHGGREIPKRTTNRDICARTRRGIHIVGDRSPSPQQDRHLASCRNPPEDQRDGAA